MQDFLADIESIAQAIRTNILNLQGEWWEDLSKGLPLFKHIIGQSGAPERLSAVDLLIKEQIIGTQGVAQILDFQNSYENRKYAVNSCTVLTSTGQTATVSGVTF